MDDFGTLGDTFFTRWGRFVMTRGDNLTGGFLILPWRFCGQHMYIVGTSIGTNSETHLDKPLEHLLRFLRRCACGLPRHMRKQLNTTDNRQAHGLARPMSNIGIHQPTRTEKHQCTREHDRCCEAQNYIEFGHDGMCEIDI